MTQLPHSTQFAQKWEEWISYRKELKKPYKTQRGITQALNMLGKLSEKGAIDTINNSMAQEYQGLFEPKKGKFDKEETPTQLPPSKVQKISQEPAKYFDPAEGKDFIVGKIKQAYDTGTRLHDIGEVYSKRLQPFLTTPEDILNTIEAEALERFNRKPKNKFEEIPEVNYELEVRNRILKYNMDRWREQSRDISLEI